MKVGFTALALFEFPFETALQVAKKDGFDAIELLCEGPYLPRLALQNRQQFESIASYDFDISLHAPTVDLNPASVNVGIREETVLQLHETIDLATTLEASTITTHPGHIKRINDRLTARALTFAVSALREWAESSSAVGVIPSIENMPNNPKYFCTTVRELALFVDQCEGYATIDVGHAHTNRTVEDFMRATFPVSYYHVSDNHGARDEHLAVGDGTINWTLLKGIHKAIIEVNDYEAVKASRDALLSINQRRNEANDEAAI